MPKDINTGRIGAWIELSVANEFLKRDWEVFRALSGASYADLVIVKNKCAFTVQVKSKGVYAANESHIHIEWNMGSMIIWIIDENEFLSSWLEKEGFAVRRRWKEVEITGNKDLRRTNRTNDKIFQLLENVRNK